MAEPLPEAEAVPTDAELQPEASPEVKSKRKKLVTSERPSQQQPQQPQQPDRFDRQPVFLVMASGQIQSAEVTIPCLCESVSLNFVLDSGI